MSDTSVIHISFAKVYEFENWLFEYDRNKPFGPWPLKKDYSPKVRAGKKFYDMFGRFLELPKTEQEKRRI